MPLNTFIVVSADDQHELVKQHYFVKTKLCDNRTVYCN